MSCTMFGSDTADSFATGGGKRGSASGVRQGGTRYGKLAVNYRCEGILQAITIWLKSLGETP